MHSMTAHPSNPRDMHQGDSHVNPRILNEKSDDLAHFDCTSFLSQGRVSSRRAAGESCWRATGTAGSAADGFRSQTSQTRREATHFARIEDFPAKFDAAAPTTIIDVDAVDAVAPCVDFSAPRDAKIVAAIAAARF
jgi:hypothetical protein